MSKVQGNLFPHKSRRGSCYATKVTVLCLLALVVAFSTSILKLFNIQIQVNIIHDLKAQTKSTPEKFKTCSPPLPTLLASHPPRPDAPRLKEAAASLHDFLSTRTAESDIDSLSIAVVTPDGPIFEAGYGVLRANESEPEKRGSITRDSIYRIASITKMFAVLETLILRERGLLNWDDPVTKFLPNFTNPTYGWSDFLNGNEYTSKHAPITLRQLASHLSGIGRDYPPVDVGETWPAPIFPEDKGAVHELRERINGSREELLDAVAILPLVAPPYTFPVYSNTGFDVLGLCNAAAGKLGYRELMERDVFEPLAMKSSFYPAQVAVPSSDSEVADLTFDLVNDPSGGQYSSLADLVAVMQTLLSPKETGVISPYVVREWLRPLHSWSDGFRETGAPWEMERVAGEARLYTKGGNLPGYHSQFVLNPQWSYGIVVLVTGNYTDTATLAAEAISRFQPAFESLLLMQVFYAYAGVWVGDDSVAVITIEDQALYLQTLIVGDSDVLSLLQRNPSEGGKAVALWSTGRPHEFRLAIGRPELNNNPDAGCEPYWISLDFPFSRGAPLDLLYWDGSELVYPSAGVRLRRD
ncbi:beta-lactamase/transpeptidase-like protein [Mycena rosella]|uniref:Beta-lactamase/transpeptidase-like protein n=1 Tax=Mycena rosella TaxID=1033263 RepID=A0AAD7GV03_MYCRO|nr:beta-lactamase/transpeptidase-like protein [Mycena rosella]